MYSQKYPAKSWLSDVLFTSSRERFRSESRSAVVIVPQVFRRRTGAYACYAKPPEPRAAECDQVNTPPGFHPLVQPVGDEPVTTFSFIHHMTGDDHRYPIISQTAKI